MNASLGPTLVAIGVVIVLIGLIAWTGALDWLGRLPGDLRIARPGFRLYVPLATMLVISLLLSGLAYLWRRFF